MLGHNSRHREIAMAHAGPNMPSHALVDVPFHGFWLLDVQGKTDFANHTMAELLGEIPQGTPIMQRIAEPHRVLFEDAAATLELGVADELDLDLLSSDGHPVPSRMWLSPRTGADGTYEGYVAIVQDRRDVSGTEPKHLLEAGQVTQYLTAGVAHSLNTSLQAVLGYGGLVLDDAALADKLKGPMQNLYDAARAATRLVTHLLSLTDLGDDSPAVVGITSLLQDAVASREAYMVANNVTIIRPTLDEEVYVWGSPPKLRRAMSHLLTNASALALAHGGGTMQMEVDASADTLVMALEVRGHRYPQEIVNFDPSSFSPTLPQAVMTHALAVGLVRELGGHLEAINSDAGARVLVALPRASDDAVDAYRQASTPAPASPQAKQRTRPATDGLPRVLVVDDEAFILELSESALTDLCEVTTISTADEAQALLETASFDLIVSDLRMPGVLDGLGLYRWATASRPDLANNFVFTTADTVSRQAAEFLMSSGRPYLQKPFDVRNYRRFVSDELDRAGQEES
jgi:CheY-like chemotaxis protein